MFVVADGEIRFRVRLEDGKEVLEDYWMDDPREVVDLCTAAALCGMSAVAWPTARLTGPQYERGVFVDEHVVPVVPGPENEYCSLASSKVFQWRWDVAGNIRVRWMSEL